MIDEKLFPESITMSTIPISVTKEQFDEHIYPFLSTAQRGYECKIPLVRVFNYLLYRLHTGCQWAQIPIAPDPADPTKRNSVGRRFTITPASGAGMAVWNRSGSTASRSLRPI
jgi:hypothetical protein